MKGDKVKVKQEKNLLKELQFHIPLVNQCFCGIVRLFGQNIFKNGKK